MRVLSSNREGLLEIVKDVLGSAGGEYEDLLQGLTAADLCELLRGAGATWREHRAAGQPPPQRELPARSRSSPSTRAPGGAQEALPRRAIRECTAKALAEFGMMRARREQAIQDELEKQRKKLSRPGGGGGPTADEIKMERAAEAASRRAAAEDAKHEKSRLIAEKARKNKNKYAG
mmetsp:Transcript_65630/g.184806  ORF Transcript_65630/g.184806 Transcript_65630/m.184806 type:complete len:176 (-) Transcript_65630:82-609(-)